jgi:predicted nucleic acid-binding protein
VSIPLVIVADTSPLIALSTMGVLPYLPSLFGRVYIPDAVLKECSKDLSKPMAMETQKAVESEILSVMQVADKKGMLELSQVLDEGEAAAIVLAKELNAYILIDEKAGRQIAKREGLKLKGSMYCLVECKKNGLIDSALNRIQLLKEKGYYLDNNLVSTVLTMCGE